VTNTGKKKINYPIKVTDDHIDNGNPFRISGRNGELAVGGKITYKRTYTITQADFDAGSVTNLASATGYFCDKLIKSNDATVTVNCVHPALTLDKSADPKTYDTEGQTITYTYTVTNSGDVEISRPITVFDNKLGTVSISSLSLSPGQTITGTATHTISQGDLEAGSITNEAYATGKYCGKEVKSNTDTETVTKMLPDTQIPEFPSIALPVASILGLIFVSQYRKKEE